MGVEIPWHTHFKILGFRFLSFTYHFHITKVKAQRRLNYLKFISSRTRGVTSNHMIILVNSIIRSCLEYGAPPPLFYDSPPSDLKILETSYYEAIRLATGLPIWTPLPVLRREACAYNLSSRLILLSRFSLIRLLSYPPELRLGVIARSMLSSSDSSWKWWNILQDLTTSLSSPLQHIPPYCWPPPPGCLQLTIISEGLAFQDTTLPDVAVSSAWWNWFSSLPSCSVFATDASKDANKTSIAAIDCRRDSAHAGLVPHQNSVFTAEALAIQLALTRLPMTLNDVYILTDSLSVLKALEA